MSQESFISISGLQKSFGSFKAVDDLSLTVYKGDIYGFLGPNGAGKSTTIRMMLSLIKPESGSIKIFGKDVLQNRSSILRNIGALIERPDFYKYLSAYKNLEILATLSGVKVSKSKIYELLELVGLKGRELSKSKTYSQGMKQRLGLAQALLHDPELLILDEPSNGLDPQGIKEMRELIVMLNREKGKTILLSSHQLTEVELMANRMIIINKGKNVVEGDVQQLLHAGKLHVIFTVTEIDKAFQLVQKDFFNHKSRIDNHDLIIEITHDEIPIVNKALVQGGINVIAIKPTRALEELFLSLT